MYKKNLGDNYNHRITLRLNDSQYEFIVKVSKMLDVSPSDYIRMTINAGMVQYRKNIEDMTKGSMPEGTVGTNENVKTNINDII